MKSTIIFSIIAAAVLLISTNPAYADTAAIRTMASITMNLNHFPSDADKQMLAAITHSDDSSESEIAVATAISNIKHKVSAGDKEKLNSIIEDESTPTELRTVASVLISINHTPTKSDKERLKKIAAGADQ